MTPVIEANWEQIGGKATNVLAREREVWRIVHVQTRSMACSRGVQSLTEEEVAKRKMSRKCLNVRGRTLLAALTAALATHCGQCIGDYSQRRLHHNHIIFAGGISQVGQESAKDDV